MKSMTLEEENAYFLGEIHYADLQPYDGPEDAEFYCVNPDCRRGISCTEETPTGDGIYECAHCGQKLTVWIQ